MNSRANNLRAFGESLLEIHDIDFSEIGQDLVEFADQWEAELKALSVKLNLDATQAEVAKTKCERNTKSSTDLLMRNGIKFDSSNNRAHLLIKHFDQLIDFWPATGLWKVRKSSTEGRGVFKLLKYLGVK